MQKAIVWIMLASLATLSLVIISCELGNTYQSPLHGNESFLIITPPPSSSTVPSSPTNGSTSTTSTTPPLSTTSSGTTSSTTSTTGGTSTTSAIPIPNVTIGYATTNIEGTSNTLHWDLPDDPDEVLRGFEVRGSLSGFPTTIDDGFLLCNRMVTDTPNNECVHHGVNEEITYYYSIFTVSTSGTYGDTAFTLSITPADRQAPGEVSNIQATVGENIVFLTWDSPPDPDLKGVLIRYDWGQVETLTSGCTLTATQSWHTGVDGPLPNIGQTYQFDYEHWVGDPYYAAMPHLPMCYADRCYQNNDNHWGDSCQGRTLYYKFYTFDESRNYSDGVSFQVDFIPEAPLDLVGYGGLDKVYLSWNKTDSDGYVDTYEIYMSTTELPTYTSGMHVGSALNQGGNNARYNPFSFIHSDYAFTDVDHYYAVYGVKNGMYSNPTYVTVRPVLDPADSDIILGEDFEDNITILNGVEESRSSFTDIWDVEDHTICGSRDYYWYPIEAAQFAHTGTHLLYFQGSPQIAPELLRRVFHGARNRIDLQGTKLMDLNVGPTNYSKVFLTFWIHNPSENYTNTFEMYICDGDCDKAAARWTANPTALPSNGDLIYAAQFQDGWAEYEDWHLMFVDLTHYIGLDAVDMEFYLERARTSCGEDTDNGYIFIDDILVEGIK